MSINNRNRKYMLAVTALVITLLFFELAFRLFDIRGFHKKRTREWSHAVTENPDNNGEVILRYKPNAQFRFCYDSNPRGYFDEDNCLTYYTNNFGLRGQDISIEKAPGTKRVILLGDSFTFGEGVKLEDTFSTQLQKIMSLSSDRPVEVLNFGVSGWQTRDEIIFLSEFAMKFKPDLVLVVYVLNDADRAGGLDFWNNFRRTYENRKLNHSYLLSYIYARIARTVYGRRYIDSLLESALMEKEKWDASFRQLLRGQELAKRGGFKYGVLIFPFMYELTDEYPFKPLNKMISDYCENHNIPVNDILPAFRGIPYTDLWVHGSDQHPNEKSHRIAAEAMAEFVLKENLL
jgi:lysophospholipase L1-like esterase